MHNRHSMTCTKVVFDSSEIFPHFKVIQVINKQLLVGLNILELKTTKTNSVKSNQTTIEAVKAPYPQSSKNST